MGIEVKPTNLTLPGYHESVPGVLHSIPLQSEGGIPVPKAEVGKKDLLVGTFIIPNTGEMRVGTFVPDKSSGLVTVIGLQASSGTLVAALGSAHSSGDMKELLDVLGAIASRLKQSDGALFFGSAPLARLREIVSALGTHPDQAVKKLTKKVATLIPDTSAVGGN